MTKVYYSEFFPDPGDQGVEGSTLPGYSRNRIKEIASGLVGAGEDSVLTRDEKIRILIPLKRELDITYNALVAQANAESRDTADLAQAYSDWNTYLGTLDPSWDDTLENTEIDREEYRIAIDNLLSQISIVQYAVLNDISTASAEIAALITALSDDNKITPNEKAELIRTVDGILAEYLSLEVRGRSLGLQHGTYLNYKSKYDLLINYLNGLSPSFRTLGADTPVDGGILRGHFTEYFRFKQQLIDALLARAQATGDEALQDAEAALSRLDSIDDDGILAPSEKTEIKRLRDIAAAEYTALDTKAALVETQLSITIPERGTFTAKYGSLTSYVNPLLTNMTTNSVVTSQLTTVFADFYSSRQALVNALTQYGIDGFIKAGQSLVRLDDIASDNRLTASEKAIVRKERDAILAEFDALYARAAHSSVASLTPARQLEITQSRDAYQTAKNTLINDYLNLLDLTSANTINITYSELITKFTGYYTARQTYLTVLDTNFNLTTAGVLGRVDIIDDDGKLSVSEKPYIIQEWNNIHAEKAPLIAQAQALSITTELTNYYVAGSTTVGAVGLLDAYLTSANTPVAWSDLTNYSTLPGGGGELRIRFANVYAAKQALEAKITSVINVSAGLALSTLADLAADNRLTATEKPFIRQERIRIEQEYQLLYDRATAPATTSLTQARKDELIAGRDLYSTARYNIVFYIDSLDLNSSTTIDINSTYFNTVFAAYYLQRQTYINLLETMFDSETARSLARLDIIDDDNVLSITEKPAVIQAYDAVLAERDIIYNQAISLAIPIADINAYYTTSSSTGAFNRLQTYLTARTTPVAWNNLTNYTTLPSGGSLRTAFVDYYTARETLKTLIRAKINTTAENARLRLVAIEADGIVSPGEKAELATAFALCESETYNTWLAGVNAQVAQATINEFWNNTGSTVTDTGAWPDLRRFRDLLNLDNRAVDTAIPGGSSALSTVFSNFNGKKSALVYATSQSSYTRAEAARLRIVAIESDGIVTDGEKVELRRYKAEIEAEASPIYVLGRDSGVSLTTVHEYWNQPAGTGAYVNLLSNLITIVDSVGDLAVGVGDLTGLITTYNQKKAALLAAVDNLPINKLKNMADDGILTAQEKAQVYITYLQMFREYTQLLTELGIIRGNTSGVATTIISELATMSNTTLPAMVGITFTYLESLNLTNGLDTTGINVTQFRNAFDTFSTTMSLARRLMSEAGVSRANSIITDVNGIYEVKLNGTGTAVVGFGLRNEAGTSEFAISADKFKIVSPTGTGPRTVYAAGKWSIYDGNLSQPRVELGLLS